MPQDQPDKQVTLEDWEREAFTRAGVPEGLRQAIISQESGGNLNAVSPTGVKGRYQVTRATAKQYGLDRDDPWQQPVAAAKHLRSLYDSSRSRYQNEREAWLHAAAEYYGGGDAVKQGGVLSTGTKDDLSNPARYAEGIAKRWSEWEKGQSRHSQPKAAEPESPDVIRLEPGSSLRNPPIALHRPGSSLRNPPIALHQPGPFGRQSVPDVAGQVAAKAQPQQPTQPATPAGSGWDKIGRAGQIMRGKQEARQKYEQLNRGLAKRGIPGITTTQQPTAQEKAIAEGIAQAEEKRALEKQGWLARTLQSGIGSEIGKLTQAEANLQALAGVDNSAELEGIRQEAARQQSIAELDPSMGSQIARGTVGGLAALPRYAALAASGGIPAVIGGTALSADWTKPTDAAVETAMSALPIGAAQATNALLGPARTMGGAIARNVGIGSVTGGVGSAASQGILHGQIDPRQVAVDTITGATTAVADPSGYRVAPSQTRVSPQPPEMIRPATRLETQVSRIPGTPAAPVKPSAPVTKPAQPATTGQVRILAEGDAAAPGERISTLRQGREVVRVAHPETMSRTDAQQELAAVTQAQAQPAKQAKPEIPPVADDAFTASVEKFAQIGRTPSLGQITAEFDGQIPRTQAYKMQTAINARIAETRRAERAAKQSSRNTAVPLENQTPLQPDAALQPDNAPPAPVPAAEVSRPDVVRAAAPEGERAIQPEQAEALAQIKTKRFWHGTQSPEQFTSPRGGSFLTSNRARAREYARGAIRTADEPAGAQRVYPVTPDVQNPFVVRDHIELKEATLDPDRLAELKAQGYDSVVGLYPDGDTVIVPFSDAQIKGGRPQAAEVVPLRRPPAPKTRSPFGQRPGLRPSGRVAQTRPPEYTAPREATQETTPARAPEQIPPPLAGEIPADTERAQITRPNVPDLIPEDVKSSVVPQPRSPKSNRQAIEGRYSRSEVVELLKTQGMSDASARARVKAMKPAEVRERLDALREAIEGGTGEDIAYQTQIGETDRPRQIRRDETAPPGPFGMLNNQFFRGGARAVYANNEIRSALGLEPMPQYGERGTAENKAYNAALQETREALRRELNYPRNSQIAPEEVRQWARAKGVSGRTLRSITESSEIAQERVATKPAPAAETLATERAEAQAPVTESSEYDGYTATVNTETGTIFVKGDGLKYVSATMPRHGRVAIIDSVYVDDRAKRQGVGTKAVISLLRLFDKHGVREFGTTWLTKEGEPFMNKLEAAGYIRFKRTENIPGVSSESRIYEINKKLIATSGAAKPAPVIYTPEPPIFEAKPVKAKKNRAEDRSLSAFIKREGGLSETDYNRGDLRNLKGREGGQPGLINRRGLPADTMREMANEAGYGPYETVDDFIQAVHDEARGVKSYSSAKEFDHEAAYRQESQAHQAAGYSDYATFDRFLNDKQAAEVYDRVSGGDVSNDAIRELRKAARKHKLTGKDVAAIIEDGQRVAAERAQTEAVQNDPQSRQTPEAGLKAALTPKGKLGSGSKEVGATMLFSRGERPKVDVPADIDLAKTIREIDHTITEMAKAERFKSPEARAKFEDETYRLFDQVAEAYDANDGAAFNEAQEKLVSHVAKHSRSAAQQWGDVAGLARATAFTGDLALLRNLGNLAFTNPGKFVGLALKGGDTLLSKEAYHTNAAKLHADPLWREAKDAGLGTTTDSHKYLGLEAGFFEETPGGRLIEKVPILRNIERANRVMIDEGRLTVYKNLRFGDKAEDAKYQKTIAAFSNAITGRGNLGGTLGSSRILGLLTSPRYMYSYIDQFVQGAKVIKANPKAAPKVVSYLAGRMAAVAAMHAAAAAVLGGTIQTDDPDSPDFLKVKVGENRLDFSGGALPYYRLGKRLYDITTASDRPQAAKEREIRRYLKDFMMSRLAPVERAIAGAADESGVRKESGLTADTIGTLASTFAPIFAQNFAKIWATQGLKPALTHLPLSIAGLNTDIYDTRKKLIPALSEGPVAAEYRRLDVNPARVRQASKEVPTDPAEMKYLRREGGYEQTPVMNRLRGIQKPEMESQSSFDARVAKADQLFRQYGGQLVGHARYRSLSDEAKKSALTRLAIKIEEATEKPRERVSVRDILVDVIETERARPRREREKERAFSPEIRRVRESEKQRARLLAPQ